MKKIFQKWTISNASEESLASSSLFQVLRSQDAMEPLPPGVAVIKS